MKPGLSSPVSFNGSDHLAGHGNAFHCMPYSHTWAGHRENATLARSINLASNRGQLTVSVTIRTYRNTDAPAVCSVWNRHYADQQQYGIELSIDVERLELFCLGKPYFRPELLWLAEHDGEVQGFLHAGPTASESRDEPSQESLVISALCIQPHPAEAEIASNLIDCFTRTARELGATELVFKSTLPNCPFYLGLGPADSLAGATQADARICEWLTEKGFSPAMPMNLWELDLAGFAPPINRTQIQIRRSASVSRQVEEPVLPWWTACILGHTESMTFQLTDRRERRVIAEVLYWMLSPELQTGLESIAWLWTPEIVQEATSSDQLLFLLAESLREFQSERFDAVRTVVPAQENEIVAILRRLGFSPVENGLVFQQELA